MNTFTKNLKLLLVLALTFKVEADPKPSQLDASPIQHLIFNNDTKKYLAQIIFDKRIAIHGITLMQNKTGVGKENYTPVAKINKYNNTAGTNIEIDLDKLKRTNALPHYAIHVFPSDNLGKFYSTEPFVYSEEEDNFVLLRDFVDSGYNIKANLYWIIPSSVLLVGAVLFYFRKRFLKSRNFD